MVRRVAGLLALAVSAPVCFALLVLVGNAARYDAFSYGRHAARIRAVISWRAARYPAPLLPLVALVDPGGQPVPVVLWLALVLVLLEVYSVCLHREAYIAAFEPHWLPDGHAPLGRPARRVADRRLHHLVRLQLTYCLPLIAMGVLADGVAGFVVGSLFLVKYLATAWPDFEAYFHWDMHCRVLDIRGPRWVAALWRLVTDWLLGPMVGALPRHYHSEHMIIHHPENAGPDDIHSPLPYDRARLLDFCVFGMKTCGVMLTSWGVVNHRRCRGRILWLLVAGVAAFWFATVTLLAHGRLLGFYLVTAALCRAITVAVAQYAWHGLTDPERPRHPKYSTILWLPAADLPHERSPAEAPPAGTDWAFFDNYHLIHHLHPRAHFTEYPELLARRIPELLRDGAIVMRLSGYESFVFDCWASRLDRVAGALVTPVPDPVTFLRRRLQPLPGHRSYVAGLARGRTADAVNAALVVSLGVLTGRGVVRAGQCDRVAVHP